MEKNPSSIHKIRFIDCDPLGHLTNSRYIDYMLNAREDHVNNFYNIDYLELSKKTGCSWVTLNNQISYLKEVRYGAKVEISSQLIQFDDKRIKVEIQMKEMETQKLYAVLWTEAIYFSLLKRKSALHTKELMQLFSTALQEIPQKEFKLRISNLLAKK